MNQIRETNMRQTKPNLKKWYATKRNFILFQHAYKTWQVVQKCAHHWRQWAARKGAERSAFATDLWKSVGASGLQDVRQKPISKRELLLL